MSVKRFICSALVAIGLQVSIPSVGSAQTYADLLREGYDATERNDDMAAIDFFERALGLRRTATVLMLLGVAEQAVGRWVAAERHLLDAQTMGGSYIDANRDALVASIAAVQMHLGSLVVHCATEGATVTIEGTPYPLPSPSPIRLLAGRVEIEVSAPGHRSVTRSVRILEPTAPGVASVTTESVVLTAVPPTPRPAEDTVLTREPPAVIELPEHNTERTATPTRGDVPATPNGAPATPNSASDSLLVAGGVFTGLGVAGIVVGGIAHGLYEERVRNFLSSGTACPPVPPDGSNLPSTHNGDPTPSECFGFQSDWRTFDALRYVGYVSGGISLAVGLGLLIGGAATSSGSTPSTSSNASCAPFADIGVACQFTF